MKQKKLIYVLLPLMILIWGLVIYRIFGFIDGNDSPDIQPVHLPDTGDETVKLPDSFTIKADYRDPFLKNVNYTPPPKKTKTPVKVKKPKKPAVNWSFVQYKGRITNQNSGKTIAVLEINKKRYLVAKGDSAAGVTLLKIFPDSVQVGYRQEKGFIKKH